MISTKINTIIIAVLLSVCTLFGQTRQKTIDAFVSIPNLQQASVGVSVKDFSGKEIISYNSQKSLTPASTLKLVTTATALELLGKNFRYETTLYRNGDKLYVVGSGDPTLGTKHFDRDQYMFLDQWADVISKFFEGEEIEEIVVIDDVFGYEGVSWRWIRQDMGNYYAAGAYGISVFDNTYELYFDTTDKSTAPKIVKTVPEMPFLDFTNTLTLNTTGRDNGYIMGEPFSNKRLLSGNIPAGRTSFSIKGDIPDPGMCLAEKLKVTLESKNVKVQKISTARNDYELNRYESLRKRQWGDVIYRYRSFPLSEIVQNINFKSNNHFSEHLIRTLGRLKNGDIYSSALDEGIEQINDFWKEKGVKTEALFMYDGCGLAPSNAVSPSLLCDILVYMQTKSKNADVFLKSLPQAGKEGTVRNLAKGTRLVGKLYAKSGSIVNVRCYAGYYISGDTKYAFSIMVNNYRGSNAELTKAIERLMLGLF